MENTSFEELYSGCGEETIPVKDSRKKEHGCEKFCYSSNVDIKRIESFCTENDISPCSYFTTVYAMALRSYTASEQVLFTCIKNGKRAAVFLGCDAKKDVLSEIRNCKKFLSSVFENEEYSYENIAKANDLKGSVCFEFNSRTGTGNDTELLFRIITDDNGITWECEYDPGTYTKYTADGLLRMIDNITGEFLIRERLGEVRLVLSDDEERIKNIFDASGPFEEKPGYRHLQDSAAKYPDRIALIAIDRTMTYRELNEEANALGHILREHGADIETKTAVLADRNSYGYVMREGALKSGSAFMPVDPEYPEERISYILEDSNCKLLVTTQEIIDRRKDLIEKLEASGVEVIEAGKAVNEGDRSDLNIDVPGNALAYVIYTSGSTGKPKGVMIENRNLANFVCDNKHNKEVEAFTKYGRVSLAMAAFTFDVSILEEFVPLSHGQTVVLATMDQVMDAQKMNDLIVDNNVEIMASTPTYILSLTQIEAFEPALKCLKIIDFGAEAFPPVIYDKLHAINPDLAVINTYGPTECTVTSTYKDITGSDDITIGYPISNFSFATFDREGRLQVPGALGELIIMGKGVGRGYIGRDDLNKRNFITLLGRPAYRSGDLVRIREDGDVEFHGRIDNQVKLRGLRVELGEIENVLGNYPGVRSCIVIVAKGETDYLAAYFTADEKVDIKSLKAHLSSYLTAYMVPQAIMQLDEMPMNLNGKIDRKALPEAVITADEVEPPENETQERILGAVKDVIGDVPVGITSDLFSFGLSSIGSIKLCAILAEMFGRSVKVSDIFENSTVRDIEKLVCSDETAMDYSAREEYPLSMTQSGIYVECMLHPESTTYNIPELYRLDPKVDTEKLALAVDKAVRLHPYLFMEPVKDDKGIIHAKRRDDQPFKTGVIKCDSLPSEEELVRPFALDSGEVLFRAEIYETGDGNYFFLDTHHIVSDGGSLDILLRDIEGIYSGEEVEAEKFTGYEFALDEEEARKSDRLEKAKKWYDSIFAGCGGETFPVKDGDKGDVHVGTAHITGNTDGNDVRRFCNENDITLNAFFTTAFGLALKSYACSENVVFTTIYNGRNDSRLENSVCMLVKTFPVYMEGDPEKDVIGTLKDCQSFLLSSMANDIFSFAEIKNAYDITADVFFAYQGEAEKEIRLGGENAGVVEFAVSRSRADLGLDVSLDGSSIFYDVEYDPSVYSDHTVKSFAHMMDIVVSQLMHATKVKDIAVTDESDIVKIKGLHDSDHPVKERPAYRLLQDSAKAFPEKKALVATDRTLTFKELNEEANALGDILRQNGAGVESIVAVMPIRDSYAYVMRQGALKCGGAFLPIDPEYPEDRIRFILEDSKAGILVAKRETITNRREMFDAIEASGIKLICVEDAVRDGSRDDLNVDVPYDALAYVIYTSGSTGKPKGVMLTNKNLVNFVDDDEKNHEIQGYTKRAHVSLAIAALTFDFSLMEEFIPIANGMTVVLATHDEIMNPVMLAKLMTDNHVDVMSCTPSYLMNLLDMGEFTDVFNEAVKDLKSVDLGAEAFPPALYDKLKALNPDIYIMNGYGPTEATISCTMQVIEDPENITIGVPNVNVHVATVDRDGRLQGLGALGELVIMGDGVGRGYIGRDDLNKKNFIRLLDMPAYRSGDLVRIKDNGDIEYHGRIDNQVKLRGLRVELGEIENVINSYPGVSSSIVLVVKKETDYLVAYFTADEKIDIGKLKEHLASQLTAYMVPQSFMQLDEMPLTANGKIDKKALPEIGVEEVEIVPPENERQETILGMVKEIVGEMQIGITTDLFAAGLSSLGCIRMCAMLGDAFNKNVTIAELFDNKTVKAIEKLLDAKENGDEFELREEYPLSMTQMGIFVESIHYPDSIIYNIPFLYELDKDTDMGRLKEAVEKTLKAHSYLSMILKRDDEGEVSALRSDEVKIIIQEGTVLPSDDELVRPFDLLSKEPLCRVGLYDTESGKYLFIDTHHIISDGESYEILFEDINTAYLGGEPEAEQYTGFEAALNEDRMRASERFDKAKEWYDGMFRDCGRVTIPAREDRIDDPGDGRCILEGRTGAEEIRAFCDRNHLSLNAFFTFATGLSLKAYTGSKNAVFATIYNGRNDSRLARSISMFVKTLPVCLKFKPETEIVQAVGDCQTMLINSMAYDIYSFAEICSTYGLNSDVLFAYQGDHEHDDTVLIGGKTAKEKPLSSSQEQAKSPFGLDVSLSGDKVIYEFEYDPSMYGNKTIDHFFDLMENVIKGMLKGNDIAGVLGSPEVKSLSGKSVAEQETGEISADKKAASTEFIVGDDMRSRQFKALEDQLLKIYQKVLKNDDLKSDDNFFEHGGTSLLAAKIMMATMVKDFPVVYQDIFDSPTPKQLAMHLFAKMTEHWNNNTSDHKEHDAVLENAQTGLYEKVLSHNTGEYVDEIRKGKLGKVLVTGSVGFLGIHVIKELIDSDAEKIYCFVISDSKENAEKRLKQNFFFYFNELDESLFGDRLIPINGNITDKEAVNALEQYDIDIIINCAASVKHFAELDFLKKVNVHGVRNLVNLCLKKNIRLVQISTVSVAGDSIGTEGKKAVLSESTFDLGQEVESNGYVYSKYLAEKLIFEAIEQKGLDAKVIRMGNLMSRYEDGEFQINFNTNNFMNTLRSYATLGCFPVTELDEVDEFSPIDEVAKATVLLSSTQKEFTVFHAYNSHSIEMGDVVTALNDNGIKVDVVSEKEFDEKLYSALKDERINSFVSPLVNYNTDNDGDSVENDIENSFTVKALYRLGFHWDITDRGYIDTAIGMLKTLGFFDVPADD